MQEAWAYLYTQERAWVLSLLFQLCNLKETEEFGQVAWCPCGRGQRRAIMAEQMSCLQWQAILSPLLCIRDTGGLQHMLIPGSQSPPPESDLMGPPECPPAAWLGALYLLWIHLRIYLGLSWEPLSRPLCGQCQEESRKRIESFFLPLTPGHRQARSDGISLQGFCTFNLSPWSRSVIYECISGRSCTILGAGFPGFVHAGALTCYHFSLKFRWAL